MSRVLGLMSLVVGVVLSVGAIQAQEKKPVDKEKQDKPVTVTAGGVTYVVTKSAIEADGKKWTLVLEATSKSGDKKILIDSARAITPDGKTFSVKSLMGRRSAVALPEDTRILIELKMGDLPKDVTTLARVELFGDRVVGIPGFEVERKGFGGGKTAEIRPLVLKDVRVERAEK